MSIRVLVPLASGFEELEAISITDLCTRAGFEVVTAGIQKRNIHASRGLNVIADTVLAEVMQQSFDAIILPGGLPGADHLCRSQELKQLLLKQHQQQKMIAAICAAPKILVTHGIIQQQSISAYPGSLHHFIEQGAIDEQQLSKEAICQSGHIITSRGPGTALDFTLKIIELLSSRHQRLLVESALER